MLELNRIREMPEQVKNALVKRGLSVDFVPLLEWDRERRQLVPQAEELKSRRNRVSSEIPQKKKSGEDVSALLDEMKVVSGRIKDLDGSIRNVDGRIYDFLSGLPNIPDEEVPSGGKENNRVIREVGGKVHLSFSPKNHVEIVESLGMVDYKRGVKLGGNGFWLYRGKGALLEWQLLNYFIDRHLEHGYELILPPHLLNYSCGFNSGQFPKFEEDVFFLAGKEKQFLLPTSETALASLHAGEILSQEDLPRKYIAFTPCYRKEAGSYRASERGMIRGHQFNKIEMFHCTTPEESDQALLDILEGAESLIRDLNLHYRVSLLAAEDCASQSAKTYDVEVWIPSMESFIEVSSVSNTRDYQARRGNVRFKRKDTGKNEFPHLLNGSGLATSRLLPAICEQFQQQDGSITVPEILQDRIGFERIEPV